MGIHENDATNLFLLLNRPLASLLTRENFASGAAANIVYVAYVFSDVSLDLGLEDLLPPRSKFIGYVLVGRWFVCCPSKGHRGPKRKQSESPHSKPNRKRQITDQNVTYEDICERNKSDRCACEHRRYVTAMITHANCMLLQPDISCTIPPLSLL